MLHIHLPEKIRAMVSGLPYEMDSVGLSGSTVITFDAMVLKIEDWTPQISESMKVLAWAQDRLPVPRILCHQVMEGKSYLLMSRIPGKMACDPFWMERPEDVTALLAQGLHMIWHVPADPFLPSITLEDDLNTVRRHVADGRTNDELPEWGFSSPAEALAYLETHRPSFDPVLSHGDYCMPNVLLDQHAVSGFIDLGHMCVQDRYVDIADCYRSLKHNYDGTFGGKVYPDFDPDLFLQKLNIQVDRAKLQYYLVLGALL